MKQRFFCLILMISLLLCACDTEEPMKIEQPFVLYYPTETISAENGTLCTMTISLDTAQMMLEEIIHAYRSQTPPEGAVSAIPASWTLRYAQIEDTTAVLTFSGAEYSKSKSYLAAACLTKTLTQLSMIDSVQLTIPGLTETIQLSDGDILLNDTGMLPQKESIVLYLPDDQNRYLIRQTQTVEAMDVSEKPQYVLQSLIDTLNSDSCIPKGTRLLSVSVENGICTVNLSSEFVRDMQRSFACERLAIYSIVNSLTELPEITTVDFWIEGAPLEQLTFMQLPTGLERDERLLAPVGSDTMDVNLYVSCGGETLVALPYTLHLQEEKNPNELLINALIAFEGDHGAANCIPEGTKLLSLRMEGTACIIDLTGEFLSECKSDAQEQLAVRSIVATMYALDEISSVEILVEGLEPTYRVSWLKNIRQPENNWYAEP